MKKLRLLNHYFLFVLLSGWLLFGAAIRTNAQERNEILPEKPELAAPEDEPSIKYLERQGKTFYGTDFHSEVSNSTTQSKIQMQTNEGLKSGNTFVVTITDDSGEGSLRWAIQQANGTADLDIIQFNIPGVGPHVIQPLDRLGYIINPVIIDGTSQPGWAPGAPVIVLDGSQTPDGQEGFRLYDNAHGSEIRGLVIGGFDRANQFGENGFAIVIETNNNKIQGNFLGVAPDGVTPFPNLRGVQIMNSSNNLVGGTTPEERNVISGNLAIGATVFGNEVRPGPNSLDNIIRGNYFGTDITGTIGVGNQTNIQISEGAKNTLIGGTLESHRNIISGASGNIGRGIVIATSGTQNTQIKGNFIGTDVTGTVAIPNTYQGINLLQGVNQTTIGGTEAGARNIISGNGSYGIGFQFSNSSPGTIPVTNNSVIGNYIGLNVNGNPLPNGSGILISGLSENNIIGGTSAAERNVISGNNSSGILLWGENAKNNQIKGNFIGTNPEGSSALPNNFGVYLFSGANNNNIGGTIAGEGNLISGNSNSGIYMVSQSSDPAVSQNKVFGNLIGTDHTGSISIPNVRGVYLVGNASNNQIGSEATGSGNVISGNSSTGVSISGTGSSHNSIQGNRIGLNGGETGPLANNFGITVSFGATNNTIGGLNDEARNIISGNSYTGIQINGEGTTGNQVINNFIGTNPTGASAIGNGTFGITIETCQNNQVSGNLISGNGGGSTASFRSGIRLFNATENIIAGNKIGTDITGAQAISNQAHGIYIASTSDILIGSSGNLIGGDNPLDANIISGNTGNGIYITSIESVQNQIFGNKIGTDLSGNTAIPNSVDGIQIVNAVSNQIGGLNSGEGNIISGNTRHGINISGANSSQNQVTGNNIGLNVNSDEKLANKNSGINLSGNNNLIQRNIISGNDFYGVYINATSTSLGSQNQIIGNLIGTNAEGQNFGNGSIGVYIVGGSNNKIGGIQPNEGNVIAFTTGSGVHLASYPFTDPPLDPVGNAILKNSIYSNTQLGIRLAGLTITANDAGDADIGPNKLQNFPEIAQASYGGGQMEVTYFVPSAPENSAYPIRVEFFRTNTSERQGKTFLGFDEFTVADHTAGTKTATFAVAPELDFEIGNQITATATDADGNTSHFGTLVTSQPGQVFYTITSSAGPGGTIEPLGETEIAEGGSQLYTITPDTGFEIADVLVDGSSVGAVPSYLFEDVISNRSIHATFQIQTFTIAASAGTGGMIDPVGNVLVEYGASQSFTITPDTGFEIDDVMVDEVSVGALPSYTFENVTADHAIVASFKKQTFTIVASAGTGGSIDPVGNVVVEYGENQNFVITADSGYEIADVLVDGVSVGAVPNYTFQNVVADHTIEALFDMLPPDLYTLTLEVNPMGAGTVSGGGSYEEGQLVPVSASANAGYDFANWTRSGVQVSAAADFSYEMPAENVTLVANFVKQTFTIVASAGTGGSIDPVGNVVVEYGENQSFVITADSGYEIADVLVDGVSVGAVPNYTFQNVVADHTIEALFDMLPPDLYTLTLQVNPMGAGTVSGGGSYEEGQLVPVSASANAGYDFANWTRSGVQVSAAADFSYEMPAENVTLVANFVKQTFTIVASAGTGGSIDPVGNVVVEYGENQSFCYYSRFRLRDRRCAGGRCKRGCSSKLYVPKRGG
jgi:hypothetical protein